MQDSLRFGPSPGLVPYVAKQTPPDRHRRQERRILGMLWTRQVCRLAQHTRASSLIAARHWGLYLGRPPVIKLCDVYVPRPSKAATSWDAVIFAAWTEVLDIAGQISECLFVLPERCYSPVPLTQKRNTDACSLEQIDYYMDALQRWDATLDHTLIPSSTSPPAVYQLR